MTARRRKTTAPARTSTKDRAARAGARPPADHLARTEATGDTITFTWGDWKFTTDKDALDDYKRISMLNAGFADPMLAVLIPDADLRNEFLESLADEDGRLRASTVVRTTIELLNAANAGN